MDVCKSCGKSKRPVESASRKIDPSSIKKLLLEGIDPWCNPNAPVEMDIKDAEAAKERIKDFVKRTEIKKSHISEICGIDVLLKTELFQYSGSCKDRGALNALLCLTPQEKAAGVIAASTGNHALALSRHGQILGINTMVIMPKNAPLLKQAVCEKYGAKVILHGESITDCVKHGLKLAAETGKKYINGYDLIDVLAGASTIGFEIIEQVPDADCVVFPVGGGGLVSGNSKVLKHLKPSIKVYGINTVNCPSFNESLNAGKSVQVKVKRTIADGAYVPVVGHNSVETAKKYVDKMLLVSEEYISSAIVRHLELDKLVTEGAGSLGMGAILSHQLDEFKGKKIVIVVTGGNIDTNILCRAIDRGIAAEGRYIKITCWLPRRIGTVQEFCRVVDEASADIKYIIQEDTWITSDVFKLHLKLIVYTKSWQHSMELKKMLDHKYPDVNYIDYPAKKEIFDLY